MLDHGKTLRRVCPWSVSHWHGMFNLELKEVRNLGTLPFPDFLEFQIRLPVRMG
jgi:hypothetical protein